MCVSVICALAPGIINYTLLHCPRMATASQSIDMPKESYHHVNIVYVVN